MGSTWSYLDATPLGRQDVGRLAGGLPTEPALQMVELARQLRRRGLARPEVGRGVGRRRGRLPEPRRRREGMTEAYHANSTGGASCSDEGAAAALGTAKWLCLAATPTFAIMALMTGVLGEGPMPEKASTLPGASPRSPRRLRCCRCALESSTARRSRATRTGLAWGFLIPYRGIKAGRGYGGDMAGSSEPAMSHCLGRLNVPQVIAIGEPGEPVAPVIGTGTKT